MIRGEKKIGSGYDLLKKLASLGLTQQQIADMLCFSKRTLRNRLRDDEHAAEAYNAGRAEIAYEIASQHRAIALGGSQRESRLACEFWLERQFGWGAKPDVEAAKPAGGVMLVPMPITSEEWEAAAIAYHQAFGAIAEREVHRLEAAHDEHREGGLRGSSLAAPAPVQHHDPRVR